MTPLRALRGTSPGLINPQFFRGKKASRLHGPGGVVSVFGSELQDFLLSELDQQLAESLASRHYRGLEPANGPAELEILAVSEVPSEPEVAADLIGCSPTPGPQGPPGCLYPDTFLSVNINGPS
jgi:hypothetical protein